MGWDSEPDPKAFPDPHLYATWMRHRSPQFKSHSTMAHVKNAITGKTRNGALVEDVYVYRYDEDLASWIQLHFMEKGADKKDGELFKRASPKSSPRAPSKKALDATIASIQQALGG